ncbi:MAG: hypothetical protein IKU15_06965 [Clostridia bacterium]|jgi:hypothetical protein|nr:hypothetical protein [Clostridia bacterium]MBR5190642.1 hypothetical protein [Clostridia bacterium]
MAEKSKFLTYKNKPLVRNGNTLYYGDASEKYVIYMQILTTKEVDGVEVASKVSIQLINTDPNISMREKIVKASEKRGLCAALDIAEVWLTRALAE